MNFKCVWVSDGMFVENLFSDGYLLCCQWLVFWLVDYKKNVKILQNVWM